LRNRVSDRERLYIEARYHSTVVPDVGKAIDAYKLLLASYPTDYAAWGNMGTLLRQRGDLAAAVSAMEEAIRLAPEQPVAYGNLGSAYTDLQRYDDARRTYEALLKLQDGSGPRIGLYVIGILTGDQSLADAQVEAVRGHRDESQMTGVRIQGLAYQGRVREAHELWPTFLFQMEQTSRRALAGEPGIGLAITDALVGYPDRASARLRELEDEDLLTPATIEEQMVLAALMRDRALADRALPQAMKASDNQNETDRANAHRFLRALHQLASGNPAAAADEMNGVPMTPNYSQVQALLASAHIGAGRTAEAIKVLQWLDSPDSRLGLGVGVVRGYVKVQLARELAHAGRVAEARAAYQQFFDHWKAADADLPLLTQAREEFSKLGS
jgi:tetratricopeptide (TPR) repeat protein